MRTRHQAGLVEFIPSIEEKELELLRGRVFTLIERIERRLNRVEQMLDIRADACAQVELAAVHEELNAVRAANAALDGDHP